MGDKLPESWLFLKKNVFIPFLFYTYTAMLFF
jgi:hypothetical protein